MELERALDRNNALNRITKAQDRYEATSAQRLRAIIEARHAGATWQQIAKALGTDRQTAHRRFNRYITPTEQNGN